MGTQVNIGSFDGEYIEDPPQSGFYTFPPTLIEEPPGSGLYMPGSLVESSTPGLYVIPSLVFSSLKYIKGLSTNIVNWSVAEDATTIDPSTYDGGAGQIQVDALAARNTLLSLGKELVLSDDDNGVIQATVRDVSESDHQTSIVADSSLALFNSWHTVQPFVGTLAGAFSYYLGVVGITSSLDVRAPAATRAVAYPGWVGNMWDHIKQICAAERVEITVIQGTVVVRPIRTRIIKDERVVDRSVSVNKQESAEKIEVTWRNNKHIVRKEVYPVPSETERPSPIVVERNDTVTFTVQLDASLSSVNQPRCIDFVEDKVYDDTNGVYSVIGSDDLPIKPAQWADSGGRLSVRITEDPSVIEITVSGGNDRRLAPYTIAMSSGNRYNSLHITGTGVAWSKESTFLDTGAGKSTTGEEVGVTIDNPFISTYEQALTTAQVTSKRQAMSQTFNSSITSVQDQVFGDLAGSRTRIKDAMYRIENVSVTKDRVSLDGVEDTTMLEFSEAWAGKSAEAFTNYWAGKDMQEFAIAPLRTTDA